MRRRLFRLESYVLTQTLTGVGAAFAILATIITLIDFVELSRSVGGRSELSLNQTLELTALSAPAVVLSLLPFAFLFGVLGAFVSLNRRSELIAMRAAGISAWRFIFPAAAAALLIGLLTVSLISPVATLMNAQYEKERDAFVGGFASRMGTDTWIRQGDAQTQIVIHALTRDEKQGQLRLHHVSLFISTPNRAHGLQFSRRIEASEARLMPGYWQLIDAREATPGAGALSYDSLSIPSALNAHAALERFAPPQAVPFWGLWRAIRATEQAGFSANGYRLALQEQLARPLMFAAMSILAAAFSLRLVRLGGLAMMAGSGVGLGFVLFFLNEFCGALGSAGAIPPFAAAWTPPLLALLSGFTLLCYTEDG